MLSPAGVCQKPEGFDLSKIPKGQGPPGWVKKIATSAWKNKWSPFGLMRKSGSWVGKKMTNFYISRRLANVLTEEEREHLLVYMHQVFMRDGSTEYAIFICFELGMYAVHPLERGDRLGNPALDLPISFFYGDVDWMDYRGGERIVKVNKYADGLSHVYIVQNSDHHMYFDNPQHLAELVIQDI